MSDSKQKLQRYEEIKMAIADLEKEAEALKPDIVAIIPEGKNVETEYGVFSVQNRATWKFSADHKKMKDGLKELEEIEKSKGIAKATYNPILYYTAKKE